MGNIPLVALATQTQQPSPLQEFSTLQQILTARQNQQYQAQAQPLELQQKQQEMQSGAVDLQMKQLALKNSQVAQGALTDPNFQKDFDDWQKTKSSGTTGTVQSIPNATSGQNPTAGGALQLHPLAQYLAERKGLSMFGPGGALEISSSLTSSAQKLADLAKTQGEAGNQSLEQHTKQLDNFNNLVEPILTETNPAKQQQQIQGLQQEIQAHPDLYPVEATQHLDKLNNIQSLQAASNTAKVREMVLNEATKQSEAWKASLAASTPTSQQIQDATRTVGTYGAIPQNMRAGLINEMQTAPNYETLQKVQSRADAANESFQRSADARAQAEAMKDVAVGQAVAGKLVEEDKALSTTLQSTSGIRNLLDMTTGGNQTASAAALTRFAEHEVKEGGINRFNETELKAIGPDAGSWARQFQTWIAKGSKGTPPAATNSEIQAILNMEDSQAKSLHDQNVGFIQNRFLPLAGGKAGRVLQSAPPAATPTGNTGATSGGMPPGATHIVFNRADGKNHYTDANNSRDYGVAP